MATIGTKFQDSLKESLMIAAIGAAGSAVGGLDMVSSALTTTGVTGMLPANLRAPLVVFGFVFVADMIYNLFLA